jgi:hypothetical protein
MIDFQPIRSLFADFQDKRVLVVGIGGGCDIISAYAIAELLEEMKPSTLVYANTKRSCEGYLEQFRPHVFRVPRDVRALSRGLRVHGTTRIEQSVPRGHNGCPFVFHLVDDDDGRQRLQDEIEAFSFDIVVGVDTGGDVIAQNPISGTQGRDKRMLNLLRGLSAKSALVVVAPGSDGESCYEDLQRVIESHGNDGRLRGWFSLEPVIHTMRSLSEMLDSSRTPNIIVAAFEDRLSPGDDPSCVTVPRGLYPSIPRDWLTGAVVLE